MNKSFQTTIARQFILYIILFSSFVTVIITALQLYHDYNNDLNTINIKLKQIETVHLGSLTAALWTSNKVNLKTNLEGILNIRDIQYLKVKDEQKIWMEVGKIKNDNNIQRHYDMVYKHRNKDIVIGELTVAVNLSGVYQRLYDTVWITLISNAIKISLVAIFVYFLFYHLVGRHLTAIALYSEKHNPLSNNKLLRLNRISNSNDEFDIVVKSINDMHQRLHEQIKEVNNQKLYLSKTLDSIGDAVITTDINGNITRLNPKAESITGWTSKQAITRPLKNVFHIIDSITRESLICPTDEVLADGKTVYLRKNATLISKDGSKYQITDSAAPIYNNKKILGMVLVFNDITEQYNIREALRKSEKQLQLIHSQIPGIVYQFKIDNHGNRSLPYVSSAIEHHLGITAQEAMNDIERWFDMVHPDEYQEVQETILKSMNQLTPLVWEGRFIKNNNETIWLSGTSMPEKCEDNSTIWNGIFLNVTERVLADEAMMRSQKMDALGKLTGGIAHDYNNMLGVILGYAELLENMLVDQPKLTEYVNAITRAGTRGAKLTKKLLSFSKNKTSTTETLNINKILLEEKQLLEKTLTARIDLIFILNKDLFNTCIDESELEDAILNMCINAMHAIKTTGTLTIETYNKKINFNEDKELDILPGDYAILKISDTGCGMTDSVKEKIFDPFYSTKGESGTGLGLSQVYGFVTRSGGIIKVDSVINKGSIFTLYFPRRFESSSNKKVTKSIENEIIEAKEEILVVDDEVALLNLTYEILSNQGYHVHCADSAEKALDILKTQHIDLMFSDIIMPQMDGYTLASIVSNNYPQVKIQLASGYSGDHTIENNDTTLSENILQKPYGSKELLKCIRLALI